MNAVDVVRRLHEHRMWANHQLLAAAGKLSPETLRQTFAIGQGSIWKSLLHLYAAEYVWIEALQGNQSAITPGDVPGKLPGNQEAPGAIESLEQLEADWRALDARWQSYLANLRAESLEDSVIRVSSTGKTFAARRVDSLLHVCTHASYTVAQVVNMLRQSGAESFPDIMLISLARQQMLADR
ncbi:MAG TPA: DinB family protein [Pirellulales bacterium]|nr:DinB family protein [Pirellulales bacterium]